MSKARSAASRDGGGRQGGQQGRRTADVFLLLLALRIANALIVQTFFQPDEFFQSLEPAWGIAFGRDSGAWITWEWEHQLRSSIHPYIFAAVYKAVDAASGVLQLSPLRRGDLLIAGPKVVQGFISAVGDYYTWRLGRRIYDGRPESTWILGLAVLSPWQWFCSTRTLSNCLETSLTVTGLYLWPWQWSLPGRRPLVTGRDVTRYAYATPHPSLHTQTTNRSSLRACLLVASLACVLRPTNTIIWFSLAVSLAYTTFRQSQVSRLPWTKSLEPLIILLRECVLCGSSILAISVLADRAYYGTWTLPPFRFLYFNVIQSLAVFYGKNDWHYYLSQGYPLLLITALPFAFIGMFQSLFMTSDQSCSTSLATTVRRQLSVACIAMPAILSLVPHKEVRFIYPILPCLHILAAAPVSNFFTPSISSASGSYTPRRLLLIFPSAIRAFPRLTVGFLMPCHSTPWRSHLVSPHIRAWALGCEPPVNLSPEEKATYVDEADQFYNNPTEFLSQNMASTGILSKHFASASTPKNDWPDYLVFFSHLEPTIKQFLRSSSYAECYRTFNTAWHDDARRKGDVIVWCRDPKIQSDWRTSQIRKTIPQSEQSSGQQQQQQQRSFDRIIDVLARERDSTAKPQPESSWIPWWSGSSSSDTPDTKHKQGLLSSFPTSFSLPSISISSPFSSWSSGKQRPQQWNWPWQRRRKAPIFRLKDNIVSMYQRMTARRQAANAQRELWS
ncbi:GPI mannosyltransferase 3 [Nannizzia gypsea CBS 118893]|uniref:Mannosyltransferase n=1 Tax=Arthroderma gypseum (strain ATCC MYA-4604 / CBS 118893) TaxID=535722 RepID=E4UQF5_ARTGP|nr:GPI mannosyltransferase 3 [Nannizzia gypsea CBS 118893]EFR00025.1 GPI mannosyltransferase 3 [Nannizzia gypsea CBS 118893]